ncbi:hypothetical protein ACOI9R_34320, partial [Mesorhizobium japonicum]
MSRRAPRILFVCTGNLCRSPFAELLLRRELAEAVVASAGTHAAVGQPMDPDTAEPARGAGLDPSAHRARQLAVADIEGADLVLGLAREHRAAVVSLLPRAHRYAFTLLEFTRLADDLRRSGSEEAPQTVPDFVTAVGARRGMSPPPLVPEDDDIADPAGLGRAAHLAATEEIAAAVDLLAGALRTVVPA